MEATPDANPLQDDMQQAASLEFLHGLDVLVCPTLRDVLEPHPSPFILENYHGGGFVSDEDRVELQAVRFASSRSAGSRSQGKFDEFLRSTGGVLALPKTALRSGPRQTVYHTAATSQVASKLKKSNLDKLLCCHSAYSVCN